MSINNPDIIEKIKKQIEQTDWESVKKEHERKFIEGQQRVGNEEYCRWIENLLKNLNDVANGGEANRLNLLANLIANEIMDIKIAITKTCGIYHEKLGIISDSQNNSVVFSGSMNETGTAIQENYDKKMEE